MNLFDLYAKIVLDTDDYENGISRAGGVMNKFSSLTVAAGNLIATGISKGITAVSNLSRAAYEGYADYEQLVGGVETLFGAGGQTLYDYAQSVGKTIGEAREEYNKLMEAQDSVVANAQKAFKTAGLSANDYMETVTSFSASLIASLGGDTKKAADYADGAITDMADNANKFGTDISSIQNAYQGFAKQNYTMLDNLKLGYGGTKEEMQRLLDDAEKISGIKYDISSFADITQAIHVMQEEMGIAGATALEAETTIAGSAASMKAAWDNLVSGLGDKNADVGALLEMFMESVQTFGGNLIPVIKTIGSNIGKTLEENGPELLAKATVLLAKFAAGLILGIPDMIAKIPEIVKSIGKAFADNKEEFISIGENVVRGVWEGIKKMAAWIAEKVRGFFNDVADEARATLGIASPSKVFASIGGYMAEGVGVGWDDEFSGVRNRINNGLHFESGSVDFASSGIGRSSAGIINGLSAAPSNGGVQTVNLMMPDSTIFARYYLKSFIDEAEANGTPIANLA